MAGYSDSDNEYYALGDYGTTYSESNMGGGDYSDDEVDVGFDAKSGGYSGEKQHYALGAYGTSYSNSITPSGGNQANVYQQTYRAKNEDKQSGSYERFTAKDKTVSGAPFVDRSGNHGYKDEHTKSATYKVGDKSGYTEYYREERVKHVEFDENKSSSNNKAVGYYPKYNKY